MPEAMSTRAVSALALARGLGPRLPAGAIGVVAAVGGLVAAAGWWIDVPRLTDWFGDGVCMFPNTGVSATACGLSLLAWALGAPAAARWAGAGVALIGGLTLFQHVTGVNLGIDTLLANRAWGQGAAAAPMRMGVPASAGFMLLGLALWLARSSRARARDVATALALAAALIGLLGVVGYLYGAHALYLVPWITGVARQTALLLMLLGVGTLVSLPDREPVRLLAVDTATGRLGRWAALVIIVLPALLGYGVVSVMERSADNDFRFVVAMRTVAETVMLGAMLWWALRTVAGRERELMAAREHAEELLASAQTAWAEAERASRLKDEFLAMLSHELRTPMTAILGWSQILSRGDAAEADVREGVGVIERNARLQLGLIEDLLDLRRITTGKVRLDMRQVRADRAVQAAVEAIRPGAVAKGVALRIECGDVPAVRADPDRLQQVVFNLLSNAVKFTPSGGRVDVSCRRVGAEVEIEVRDTGAGIDAAFLPHVFERFRQQDHSTTRRYGGLGLGLAIVRQLVELHGGHVSASSEGPGRGSTFTVRLPAAGPSGAPGVAEPAPAREGGIDLAGLRVLVVDDDADGRVLLGRLLGSYGATVQLAETAEEAVQALEPFRPDVLLSDIAMPGEDGYALIDRVRRLPAVRGGLVPAVAVTAFAREEDRVRAIGAGFDGYIAKPVQAAALALAVRSALRSGETRGYS